MTYPFEQVEQPVIGEILDIQEIEPGKDLYNITAPFEIDIDGDTFILGREESADSEQDSKVVWIKKENGTWTVDRDMPSIVGQDPSFALINGELVIGVVKPIWDGNIATDWRTYFYKGKSLEKLKEAIRKEDSFAIGPRKMKDIRLVSRPDGKIGVFTRPDETKRIGYIELNSFEDLKEENLLKAEIIEVMFLDGEWGGVNEVHILDDGRLGILGHVASKTEDGHKHYRAITFIFDPKTKKVSEQHEIATSSDFPKGDAKREDLEDVIFSGGLKLHKNGKATLYVGLRDKEAASIEINAPF